MPKRTDLSDTDRRIRDTAQRESWPYNDDRANYPIADTARTAQQQGAERRAA